MRVKIKVRDEYLLLESIATTLLAINLNKFMGESITITSVVTTFITVIATLTILHLLRKRMRYSVQINDKVYSNIEESYFELWK